MELTLVSYHLRDSNFNSWGVLQEDLVTFVNELGVQKILKEEVRQ